MFTISYVIAAKVQNSEHSVKSDLTETWAVDAPINANRATNMKYKWRGSG